MPGAPFVQRSAQQVAAEQAWSLLAPVIAGGGYAGGRVRVSRDGGRSYPAGRERALTRELPNQPAAVRTYDDHGFARCLSCDFDVGRGGQAQVDQDVDRLLSLLARCGGQAFTDRSPAGGRHVYVPLEKPVHYEQMRPLLLALAQLLPSLDALPGINLRAGCLRPPGARHRTGQWQTLDGPLSAAVAVARSPNPPRVWAALSAALRPQLDALRPPEPDLSLILPEQGTGAGALERRAHAAAGPPRARRSLNPRAIAIATRGEYDPARYGSRSQARQAVHASAAASGWTYRDLLAELEAGHFPGLWAFYARYKDHKQRQALARDWLSAVAYVHRADAPAAIPSARNRPALGEVENHVHRTTTREQTTHAGGLPHSPLSPTVITTAARDDELDKLDGYQFVRSWSTALRLAERDRYRGRAGLTVRLVLRALANAGQKTGRRHLAFGVRSIAIATGLAHSTVVEALKFLREEADPLITRVVEGRGLLGDLYELRVPDAYLERARTDPWRPGRIEALLPVFRVLGQPASFTYEALDSSPQTSWDLANVAMLSPRATQQALSELAQHDLAVRTADGWQRGPADPQVVARSLGALDAMQDQVERYRRDRAAWRVRLGLDQELTVADILDARIGPAPVLPRPQQQTWQPVLAQPPPAGLDAVTAAAIELLARELGAVLLSADT